MIFLSSSYWLNFEIILYFVEITLSKTQEEITSRQIIRAQLDFVY